MEVPRKNILQRLNKKDEEKGSRSLFWSRFPFLLRDFWTFTNSIKRRFLDKQKGRSLSSTLLPSIHMLGMKNICNVLDPLQFFHMWKKLWFRLLRQRYILSVQKNCSWNPHAVFLKSKINEMKEIPFTFTENILFREGFTTKWTSR